MHIDMPEKQCACTWSTVILILFARASLVFPLGSALGDDDDVVTEWQA